MATRALIGYIENGVLTSTYNHYDGYPENLGKALEGFYNTPEKAKEVANRGYISYIDPETGGIEAVNQDTPDKLNLNKLNPDQATEEVAALVDSYGADYAYFYNPTSMKWDHIKNNGIRSMMNPLEGILFGDFDNTYDEEEMNENFHTKWKKFMKEEISFPVGMGGPDSNLARTLSQALYQLQDEPGMLLNKYKESLTNDIRLNGPENYENWTVEDFVADYEDNAANWMDY